MPDLDNFTKYIRESANELEAAILEHQKKKEKAKPAKKAAKPASDKLFLQLKKFLAAMPDNGKPKSGVFLFKVKGETVSEWTVDISQFPATVTQGRTEATTNATFMIDEEHLMKIAAGKLDVQTAFIQGRLKIDGDFDQAMRMGKILGKMLAVK